MKLEIEISEDEMLRVANEQIHRAINDKANSFGVDKYIKEAIEARWQSTVNSIIDAALNDIPAIKAKITQEIEKKLRAQLAKVLKAEKDLFP